MGMIVGPRTSKIVRMVCPFDPRAVERPVAGKGGQARPARGAGGGGLGEAAGPDERARRTDTITGISGWYRI